jgi:flagellar hook assembly protein FlgD
MTPKLVIYDLLGRRVRNLSDGRATQGRREFAWDCRKDDGERVSTGMYFARLTGSNRAMVVRVPIIR